MKIIYFCWVNEIKQTLIAYGSPFLANPDLPKRFKLNAPLNQADRSTMFSGSEEIVTY